MERSHSSRIEQVCTNDHILLQGNGKVQITDYCRKRAFCLTIQNSRRLLNTQRLQNLLGGQAADGDQFVAARFAGDDHDARFRHAEEVG